MTRNDYTIPEAHETAIGYNQLIDEVQKLDPEAAKYLRTDAQKMQSFSCAEALSSVFFWRDSPQGHEYWSVIYHTLYERSSA